MLFYLLRAAEGAWNALLCVCAPQRAGRRWNALLSFTRRSEQAVVGMLFYLLRAAESRPSFECSFIFCAPQGEGPRWNALLSFQGRGQNTPVVSRAQPVI